MIWPPKEAPMKHLPKVLLAVMLAMAAFGLGRFLPETPVFIDFNGR